MEIWLNYQYEKKNYQSVEANHWILAMPLLPSFYGLQLFTIEDFENGNDI